MAATVKQLDALAELAQRRCEALNLFRPLPFQTPFFRNDSNNTLLLGGNRSGKSVCAAVRFAAIATDRPVVTPEGERIEMRLPHQKGKPLVMWCVGLGQDHIGQTLYRLLFRPGLFKVIRDEKTREWRSYRPWSKSDQARLSESKPSPPLIPQRFINPKSWTWTNKGARVFDQVEIWNPETKEPMAMIYAFTSSGDVKAGDPVDEIWIDERIKFPTHFPEWQARLIDRSGRLVWSSWPDITNDALVNISRRATEEQDNERPTVRQFRFKMSDNPHLPKQAKEDALAGWSEEERLARDQGEFVTDTLRMYPSFSPAIHTAIIDNGAEDELSRILRERNGEPPHDWTRELILDPGTSHPAVLLCAVPPPFLGDYMVPYKEIYIPRLDADALASVVYSDTEGTVFERFIIDPNAGRQTPMGFAMTIQRNYARAFEEKHLQCRQSGSMFSPGSNDVAGRILQLQSWLTIRSSGFPKLRIVTWRCPNLCKQLERYVKQLTGSQPVEFKPGKNQKIDLATCLEYWASRSPEWIPKPSESRPKSQMHRFYMNMEKRQSSRAKKTEDSLWLGPVNS